MPEPFEYRRPRTIDEALKFKAELGGRAKFWAGGTDLMLLHERGRTSFEYCVDLSFVKEMVGTTVGPDSVRIGAMTSLEDVNRAGRVHWDLAVLHETAKWMDTWQTRTLATIGGNICHASPSGDLAPALLVLDANVEIASVRGTRIVALKDFFVGVNKTVLESDELLVAIEIPKSGACRTASYKRIARTVVDIALVSSAVSLTVGDDGEVTHARVALGAVAPRPIRAALAEAELVGLNVRCPDAGKIEAVCLFAAETATPISDIRSTKEYRKEMCRVLTGRAVRHCITAFEERAAA